MYRCTDNCPSCPVTDANVMFLLNQMATGCTNHLRGVVREDLADVEDISEFMTNGSNRLLIVTNTSPEKFAKMIQDGQQTQLAQIKAVAISSAVVNGAKKYIVMSVVNGKLSPMGSPTASFVDAFTYLERSIKNIGVDKDNLVFFIDED